MDPAQLRQEAEDFEAQLKDGEVSMGASTPAQLLLKAASSDSLLCTLQTTIVAASFNGGVVLGADSRTSNGNYVANRVTDKLTQLTDRVRGSSLALLKATLRHSAEERCRSMCADQARRQTRRT